VTGYIPAIWHQVKFVFIPKPSINSYCGPRDFSLISPTSFLLKTMDRMVDRILRDKILAIMSLHPTENAYQAEKSVEMALHQLVVQVEKALDLQEATLVVFLDIEGAFSDTSYDSICAALFKDEVDYTIKGGSELPWRAAWLQQLSVDLPRLLRYLGVTYRELFCHHSYGALLFMI
jgi:hypothetical protein